MRNYIDWLLGVPWKKTSKVRRDLQACAQDVLDADHFGLEKVKERILEYLAVQQRVNKMKGPILCLVGPPGVGKTSLGQSIAQGDQPQVRAHVARRRARRSRDPRPSPHVHRLDAGPHHPERRKVGTKNPLFVLDEIDKMSMDFRGDPSSALLEVLDPEQNHAFNDHYLEVDFDLSEVMWIATANSLNIPPARCSTAWKSSASRVTPRRRRLNIAQRYLRAEAAQGERPARRRAARRRVGDPRHHPLLHARIGRAQSRARDRQDLPQGGQGTHARATKAAKKGAEAQAKAMVSRHVEEPRAIIWACASSLSAARSSRTKSAWSPGLAWTEVGGDLLSIEATVVPGKGKLIHTGQLGDVMQESIQAALSVVRARAERLGIDPDFHQKHDIHIHVPEGATPKDGPSAGIAMCTALVSALTKVPVRSEVAMTGEITLRGRVLPIGGLKEKLLAAHRGGITTVIIPEENQKDLADIPKNVTESLDDQAGDAGSTKCSTSRSSVRSFRSRVKKWKKMQNPLWNKIATADGEGNQPRPH